MLKVTLAESRAYHGTASREEVIDILNEVAALEREKLEGMPDHLLVAWLEQLILVGSYPTLVALDKIAKRDDDYEGIGERRILNLID